MISTTSLFSKGLIKSNLKRFWWISAISAIIMIVGLPLRFMLYDQNSVTNYQASSIHQTSYDYLFLRYSPFFFFTALAIPIFVAVLLMRYMQKSSSATMLHGLPFSRNKLYWNTVLSGFILIITPAILTVLLLMIIKPMIPIGAVYSFADIFGWLGMQSLYSSVMFVIAVFVGIFTGSSIAQIVFTAILNILPYALYELFGNTLKKFLRGFEVLNSNNFFEKLPIVNMFAGIKNTNLTVIIWYIAIMIILLPLALFFYKKRHLETATDVVTFKWVGPIFKYGVTTCAMLTGYLFIESIVNRSPGLWLYFVWALIGYVIAEMLLKKSLNVWRSYKGFIAFCLFIFVIYGGIELDITGYEKRVPAADNIESVYVGHGGYSWKNYLEGKKEYRAYSYAEYGRPATDSEFYPNEKPSTIYSEAENIKMALSLHNAILKSNDSNTNDNISIGYKLKNGKILYRGYRIDRSILTSYFKALTETKEYKEVNYPIKSQDIDHIKYIEVIGARNSSPVLVSDRDKLLEFAKILENDVLKIKYEEINSNFNIGNISLRINYGKNYELYIPVYESMGATKAFLVENGLYKGIMPAPDEIESISLIPLPKDADSLKEILYNKDIESLKNIYAYKDEQDFNRILSENIKTFINDQDIPTGDIVYVNLKNGEFFAIGYITR